MPAQTIIQHSFAAGMLSPRLRGRLDLAQYAAGAEDLANVTVLPQGGVTKRPGSYFVDLATVNDQRPRLIAFKVSAAVAYTLELGNFYMRFLRNRARLTDGASPLEVATPWGLDDLRAITWAHSADVMYLFHPSYQTQKLSRTAADTFELTPAVFLNGPYDAENTGDVGASLPSPEVTSPEAGTDGGAASGSGAGDGPDPHNPDVGEGADGEAGGGEPGGGQGAEGGGLA